MVSGGLDAPVTTYMRCALNNRQDAYRYHVGFYDITAGYISPYINNNNNIQDNVYGAVIMAEPLREFTRFI